VGSIRAMDLGLDGRVVLVVGGTGLIGSAVVGRLEAEGAVVVSASRHAGLVMDARDDASVDAGIASVLAQHGHIDGLVVTAAPSAQTLDASKNSDPAQVLEAFEAKALSFLRVANAVLPAMRDGGYGRIVGVSGQNALVTGNITGSIRNAALIIAAKNLADLVAGSGVTVNSVSPGLVTPAPSGDVSVGKGGDVSPIEIADLIAFLVSPLSSGVSGESIALGHRVRGTVSL
jgi:NAD(P)-dependent dehydrogenase (short-subunit alcohol dehydrogenase family)